MVASSYVISVASRRSPYNGRTMTTTHPTLAPPRSIAVAALLTLLTTAAHAQEPPRPEKGAANAEAARADEIKPSDQPAKPGEADAAGKDAPKEPEQVYKTDEEWRKILTHDQYLVTRMKATEPPFSGRYATGHHKGTFLCVCCGAKLFDSRAKFDSGTGWPSFWRPASEKALDRAYDRSEAEVRIEVTCARCGAHLGHVFDDGPPPTGLRFCINSLAIKLDSEPARPTLPRRAATNRRRSAATRDARPQAPEGTAPAEESAKGSDRP